MIVDLSFSPIPQNSKLTIILHHAELPTSGTTVYISSNRIRMNATSNADGMVEIYPEGKFYPGEPIAISIYMSSLFQEQLITCVFPADNTTMTMELIALSNNTGTT